MDELLTKTGKKLTTLRYGDLVEGRVASVERNQILVDVAAKSEGIVAQKEIAENPEPYRKLKVGDTVLAYVLQPENERGYVVLSLRKAQGTGRWRELKEAFEKGQALTVRTIEYNKGGFLADAGGITGFIPLTHLSKQKLIQMDAPEALVGQELEVKIIEIDPKQNRLVFSEKEAQSQMTLGQREDALAAIKVGDVFEGEISGIFPFGLFVEVSVRLASGAEVQVSNVEGLCHISEVSWEKVDDLNSLYKIGDKVKVKVLEVEPSENKLALSIKEMLSNPWQTVAEKYKIGDRVSGTVSKIMTFGAFVLLEPGLEGLVHVSETIGPMKEGEKVEAQVIDVDPARQRLGLSVRKLQEVSFTYK